MMLFVLALVATPVAARTTARVRPTFDCTQATTTVPKLICNDEELAGLDRRLDRVYDLALKAWSSDEAARQQPLRQDWVQKRDACATAADVRACVEASYRTRIVEVQLQSHQLKPPAVARYACDAAEPPFRAAYYADTAPPSAVITHGDQRVIAFVVPSGSGARYTAERVELWEHQGEASVDWLGTKLACRVMP